MLILTRRVGESIVVGDDIVLTVFEVRGDAVRVGIEAPRSVQVHRQEVYDELKRLNELSVSPSDDAVEALREALDPTTPSPDKPELSVVPEPDGPSGVPAAAPESAAELTPESGEVGQLRRPKPGPRRPGR